jgi:hypothetical protein
MDTKVSEKILPPSSGKKSGDGKCYRYKEGMTATGEPI